MKPTHIMLLTIVISALVSCNNSIRAKVKCTYATVDNAFKVIDVDPMYEPGDTLTYGGVTYTIISTDRPAKECPYEGLECPNAQRVAREYQIDVTPDSVYLYDADRLVGSYKADPQGHNPMDSLIMADNL